jgi:DNA mismatch repair ATPase MutS
LSKIIPELQSFLPALKMMEQTSFTSKFIDDKKKLLQGHIPASAQIAGLKKILDRLDYRLNPVVHIPLNIFLLWDLQQALALYKWKKTNTVQAERWYDVLGEMEALSSLATLAFNRSEWVFPEVTDHWFEMECRQAGHPLIHPSKLVLNDFSLAGSPQIALVTGSNMAGKSTFLRTIGANTILAMAGAPVCAEYMKLPVTKVMSSMRITDNLEEETSTFYAELKKLKWILESVQKKEKVFLLLDEMLRGTNSLDRHAGSEALIRQLMQEGAVGIIASHDVELSKLENEFPAQMGNYHFDSAVVQEEIIFDYKLKEGICTSTNATLLMKKIGIQMG